MLYYLVRDIGVINEIETFVSNVKPTKQNIDALKRQFPELSRPAQSDQIDDGTYSDDTISFPHALVVIMGHAGTGKSHILKHFANKPKTMFYAPTNAAGINLQKTLWPSMLYSCT